MSKSKRKKLKKDSTSEEAVQKAPYEERKITEADMEKASDLHLYETYGMCNSEITLQQSKRDQTIAFYMTLLGIASTTAAAVEKIGLLNLSFIFLALGILGSLLSAVIIRYRIYKEVYWVTSRTLCQLFSIDRAKVDKTLVQTLFYRNLKKNKPSVIVMKKDENNQDTDEEDRWKTIKKVAFSSETILFFVQAMFSSFSLGMFFGLHIYYLYLNKWTQAGEWPVIVFGLVGSVTGLIMLVWLCRRYLSHLKGVYAVFSEEGNKERDEAFNKTFQKAWFLHFFVETEDGK